MPTAEAVSAVGSRVVCRAVVGRTELFLPLFPSVLCCFLGFLTFADELRGLICRHRFDFGEYRPTPRPPNEVLVQLARANDL